MANGWIFVAKGEKQFAVDLTDDEIRPEIEDQMVRQEIIAAAMLLAGLVKNVTRPTTREVPKGRRTKNFRRPGRE